MKVLHISQPVDAGVAAVVVNLIADQQNRGWSPILVCPPDGWLSDRAEEIDVLVRPWVASRSPGPSVVTETRRIRDIIRTERPDVVHLHSSKAGLTGRLALRGTTPTIFQPHLWSFQAADSPVTRAARGWERFGARWAHRLLCVSDDERDMGRRADIKGHYVVIPNGIDTDRIQPTADKAALRKQLGLSTAPLAVCVGRLAEQKGQDLLLEAWQDVLQTHPGAHLTMVGDGPLAESLQNSASGRHHSVQWLGNRSNAVEYMAAADVVVVPSRAEGMALVPLEAMASGASVVAFDSGGIKQSVGEAGAVLPIGDTSGLSAAIITRFDDPELTRLEGNAGRARAVDHFDHRRSASAVADLTIELAAETKGRRP